MSQQCFKSYISALCEYGLYCGTADCLQFRIWRKFTSQAIATPRRKAQVVLEVEETQAEIVGPAELFLRPGSKLELHCRVPLGRAGPDDHFRWTGSPLMRATVFFLRRTAVLHWFQDQRLIDPGAGREKGLVTQVHLGSDLQVIC